MKLLRFGEVGNEKPGILDGNGEIRSLVAVVDDINGESLGAESIEKLQSLDINSLPLVDSTTRLGACVGDIGKYICIGLNYADHAEESGMAIPDEPVVFNKWNSAICGPDDDIIRPRNSTKLDWEVELGLVIGKNAAYISEAEAEDAIAGYCVINDVSERKFQFECGGQWDKGKGCDTFGPTGPWMVTKDEVNDVSNLDMWLEVNGKRYQDGNTKMMIFTPAFIVSYLSQFMSLRPGDIISTGTPPGVGLGQKPPVYLNVGDVITLGITGLGSQEQKVIACPGGL